MGIFTKFNKTVDTENLKKDVHEARENGGGNFENLPDGDYEVKVEKMEAKLSKKDNPMLSIQFKVVAGQSKGRMIFYNQALTSGFGIAKAIDIMEGLDSEVDIFFDNLEQFEELIGAVSKAIEEAGLEYQLNQATNDKGYQNFSIVEVFDAK